VAQSEFSQAGDVASLLQKLRPQAAEGASQVAGKVLQAGVEESQIGSAQLFQALQGILSERGQDVNQQISNLGDLTAGLETVFGGLV
jgi:hypothetical protein